MTRVDVRRPAGNKSMSDKSKNGTAKSGRSAKGSAKTPGSRVRSPLWAKLLTTFGLIVVLIAGFASYAVNATMHSLTSTITQEKMLDPESIKVDDGKALQGAITLLLLGLDRRMSWDVNDTRADSIIILHIPASHDQAYLTSIPRDTKADIPGHGVNKINAAFYFGAQTKEGWRGGAKLMARTVTGLTGIKFDGMAIIDFNGFTGVVNALGTVHYCIDQAVASSQNMAYVDGNTPIFKRDPKYKNVAKTPIRYDVGCRNMPGWMALDYARERETLAHGDYDRQRHQRALLKAIAQKATSVGVVTNMSKLQSVIRAAGKSFILDTGNASLEDFIFTLKGLAATDLVSLKVNNGNFHGDGHGFEILSQQTLDMFEAIAQDKLGEFIQNNPEVINNDK